MYRVLFVCTGNICRSPTAEAVFRHKYEARGQGKLFMTDSAGTHGYHTGEGPDPRSVNTAQLRGVSMEGIVARPVSVRDFDEFDLILALDEGHHKRLKAMMPKDAKAKLALFLDYHPNRKGESVPDPYYGDQRGFDHVFDLIDEGAEAMLDFLKTSISYPAAE